MAFELPKLGYDFWALEPHIDAKTMEIHHGKHHATYIANLNKATEGGALADLSLEELLRSQSEVPAIRNNGGGHWNHSLFWKLLSPNGGLPSDNVLSAITKSFGSFDNFKKEFSQAAMTRFGSGWAWLCINPGGDLKICSTANQDNPLMPNTGCGGKPILGIDVWEHAYYLKYQNRRADYIDAFFNVISWNEVSRLFTSWK